MKKHLICIVIFATFLFLNMDNVLAKRDIPDDNLQYPILVTLDDGSTGSGFYLRSDKIFYFITTKHVLFNITHKESKLVLRSNKITLLSYNLESGKALPVRLEIDMEYLYNKKDSIRLHPSQDLAVVKMGEITKKGKEKWLVKLADGVKRLTKKPKVNIMSLPIEGVKKYKDVLISNEIFIFGYPSSLGIPNHPQIEYDKPLLRKGIIAGKNDKRKVIILDCPVYFGNSGGPVLEVEKINLLKYNYRIVGVVSEFIPFEDKLYSIRHKYNNTEIENSGYSIAIPMDAVLELID